jgi:hypothetical protein
MSDDIGHRKKVIVHIGPHKTGTTAIQNWMQTNRRYLSANGICFLSSAKTYRAAKLLAEASYQEASEILQSLSSLIAEVVEPTIILSHEDFSGELPGRGRQRAIYPRFLKNLRTLKRSLTPHDITFLFFERSEDDWLLSCYHQHLRHRTQFHDFEDFKNFLTKPSWPDLLSKVHPVIGDALVAIQYDGNSAAGVRSVLQHAGFQPDELPNTPKTMNSSPSTSDIVALERINALTSFPGTAWLSKELVLSAWKPAISPDISDFAAVPNSSQTAQMALGALYSRTLTRIPVQDVDDILPDANVDLMEYWRTTLPTDAVEPNVSRRNIQDQADILRYHLRGKSSLAWLCALSISYLRRNTPHTLKAKILFHRIWNEYGAYLINEFSTRWLISTLQTFFDHGLNENQRVIGGCGYFYSNMMKIYEGERSIEGLGQSDVLRNLEPQTKSRFRGLDRYKVGGTDLLLNTNCLALEISLRDEVAGLVLQEFLLRTKISGNVFTRSDATRLDKAVNIAGFEDTWSFYESSGSPLNE